MSDHCEYCERVEFSPIREINGKLAYYFEDVWFWFDTHVPVKKDLWPPFEDRQVRTS